MKYVAILPSGEEMPIDSYDDTHACAQRVHDLGLVRVRVWWKRNGQLDETALYVYPCDTRPRGSH